MRILKNIIPVLPLLMLVSCSETAPEEEAVQQLSFSQKAMSYPKSLEDKMEYFPKKDNYAIDSLRLTQMWSHLPGDGTMLTPKQVRELSGKMNRDDLTTPNQYYLNDFHKISALKQSGKYQQYVDSLDIGMVRDVNCFAIGRMEFSDSLAIMIWQLRYNSYEACPAFEGMNVIGSLIVGGEVKRSIQLAAYETSADAPVSSETYQLMRIIDGKILERREHVRVMEMEEMVEDSHRIHLNHITTQGYIKL
ncbi:MAG: hypothetical protein EP338_10710 [Bacteroidetes bacterium]|nr:MAG: hypothetical protein EP338_10710 [Bacteroidota bacterium]